MLSKDIFTSVKYLIIITLWIIASSCTPSKIIREFHMPAELDTAGFKDKPVKVHMKDGCLYILNSFIQTVNPDTVIGYGAYFNQNRHVVNTNISKSGTWSAPAFQIALSQVALIETNDLSGLKGEVLGMTIIGIPTAAISIYCIINPKACFGSCPTFYAWDGEDTTLMAEGFSSSILRSFEKQDIDMLYWTKVMGNKFNLRLTNEALETHVIRYADLMVFQRKNNERIFAADDGKFYKVSDIISPASCTSDEGDCLSSVLQMDHIERYTETEQNNLSKQEYIELNFDSIPDGNMALILGNRQTFLTTYLFYQTLAYLGHEAGYFAARIESGDRSMQKRVNKVWDLLGGIEISVKDSDGRWTKVNKIEEMGPIASDIHVIRLPETDKSSLQVRLKMTKGLWRIDYLALAKLGESVDPVRIKPSFVVAESASDYIETPQLKDTLKPLITLPGDKYNILYDLPDYPNDYEIFLCSKGYYLEWMRETWMEEEDLGKALLAFGFPRLFMKKAAPDFKKIESIMENNFWNSRYAKKN